MATSLSLTSAVRARCGRLSTRSVLNSFAARARAAMVELQVPWGERFGGTFLDDFSLHRACRATGERILEEFLCFGVVAALILARPAGPFGRAFWRCIFGWLLAMPKLYHHYGLQGRRKLAARRLQRSRKTANLAPSFRARVAMVETVELQGHWGERFAGTFLDDLSLRRACRATGESVLEEFVCFGVVAALILARLQDHWGERFGGVFFGWLLARPKLYHHYGPQGRRNWPQDGSNAAVRQPTWRLDGCICPQPGA